MKPKPYLEGRLDTNGGWLPPQALGNNVRDGPLLIFHHDGEVTRLVGGVAEDAEELDTFSVYYDRGKIWTVDYDAINETVSDGLDRTAARGSGRPARRTRRNSGDEQEENDDWAELSFVRQANYVSFAGRRLPTPHLIFRRADQIWPLQLLPDAYSAPIPDPRVHHRQYGGLIGALPLLISLAALTIPAPNIQTYLPGMIGASWRVYPNHVLPRAVGWTNKRGLVVTVYTDPGRPGQPRPSSSLVELHALQNGYYGLIFP